MSPSEVALLVMLGGLVTVGAIATAVLIALTGQVLYDETSFGEWLRAWRYRSERAACALAGHDWSHRAFGTLDEPYKEMFPPSPFDRCQRCHLKWDTIRREA